MSEHLGKLIECDRCGKTHFLNYTSTKSLDGGYTKIDQFDKRPDGWTYHSETGLICDECEAAYQKVLDEFFERGDR